MKVALVDFDAVVVAVAVVVAAAVVGDYNVRSNI